MFFYLNFKSKDFLCFKGIAFLSDAYFSDPVKKRTKPKMTQKLDQRHVKISRFDLQGTESEDDVLLAPIHRRAKVHCKRHTRSSVHAEKNKPK